MSLSLLLFWKLLKVIPIHYILCGKNMPRKLRFFQGTSQAISQNSLKASDFWDNKNQHHEFIFGTLRNTIFKKWNVFQLFFLEQHRVPWWFLDSTRSSSPRPPRLVALKPNSASSRHWDSFLLSSLCKRCLWGMGVDFLIEQFILESYYGSGK